MKKNFIFIISLSLALGIYIYIHSTPQIISKKNLIQTFEKNPNRIIASHDTTHEELRDAKISHIANKRDSLSYISDQATIDNGNDNEFLKNLPTREGRIIIGDSAKEFVDTNKNLKMTNKINPEWKNLLGIDLLKFQREDTKVIVIEEYSTIKIFDQQGQYLEQVMITFLQKNGDQSSFRAFIDSESGRVIETWDRTIHEKKRKRRIDLSPLPLENAIAK